MVYPHSLYRTPDTICQICMELRDSLLGPDGPQGLEAEVVNLESTPKVFEEFLRETVDAPESVRAKVRH